MLKKFICFTTTIYLIFSVQLVNAQAPPIIIEPSVTSSNLYRNTSTKDLSFTCSCFFTPVNCTLQFSLESVENTGGHDHHSDDRPTGELVPKTGSYVAGGSPFVTLYTAPEVSGEVLLNGTAELENCGTSSLDLTIRVIVGGLTTPPISSNYTLIGSFGEPGVTSMHVSNHHVTPTMSSFIFSVAEKFKAAFPDARPLRINDGSLKWGGLFDIDNNWNRDHGSHRFGNDLDVDDIPADHLRKLLEIIRLDSDDKAIVFIKKTHYHIRLPR